jgi:hypothetical protein
MLENNRENIICSNTDQEKSERAMSGEREEMSLTEMESHGDLLKEELQVNQ